MTVTAVFEKLRQVLDELRIPYFVSGSFASSAHGVPRATHDIDVVIAPSSEQLRRRLAQFRSSEYATDPEDAFDALESASAFQIIDYATMWKIDFMIGRKDPFDQARFRRRSIVEVAGVPLYTASAEDILLTKLWWAKLGESEKQLRDAAGIISVQRSHLDYRYIESWVATLDPHDQWQTAKDFAG